MNEDNAKAKFFLFWTIESLNIELMPSDLSGPPLKIIQFSRIWCVWEYEIRNANSRIGVGAFGYVCVSTTHNLPLAYGHLCHLINPVLSENTSKSTSIIVIIIVLTLFVCFENEVNQFCECVCEHLLKMRSISPECGRYAKQNRPVASWNYTQIGKIVSHARHKDISNTQTLAKKADDGMQTNP